MEGNNNNIYLNFFQNTKCAVFILKNNSIDYANKSSLQLFDYTESEILSLHPSDLSPLYQESGVLSIIEADKMIFTAIENGNHIFEWQHMKKDGTVFWTEIVLTSVGNNENLSMFALIKDITKRKTYQKELKIVLDEQKFLIDNIADFVYKVDKKGNLVYVSRSVMNLTGYTREEWLENPSGYLINSEDIRLIEKYRQEIFSRKIKNKKYNIEILNKDGNRLILELIESYYNNGQTEEIIGVAKDVTERYQNEMILLKSQKMELISSLSSGLVHELNNSLSVILGNIELLNRKLEKEQVLVSENICNIKSATKKANETLNHLLTISNKQTNSFKEIDLNELIVDVFSILRNSFTKSIDLNLSIIDEEAVVMGDLSQLEHMLLNILINSYQAILNKGHFKGVIELKLDKVKKDDIDYWRISVADNGTGIPQNIIPMIFDPFFSTKKNGNDLGLGLTSSRNILQAHSGFLEIESEVDKGTVVEMFIPVYMESSNKNTEVNSENTDHTKNTILIIDDEPLVLTTAKAILEEFGYDVLTSLNGEDGVLIYSSNIESIALVILDMDMPNKSGKDVFYELKAIDENVKVIISSGYENDERVKDVLENGVKEFIPKPYGISVFINTINKVLG